MKHVIGAYLTVAAAAVLNADAAGDIYCPPWCTDYLVASDTSYDKSSLLNGDNWHSKSVPSEGSTNYVGAGYTVYGPKKEALSAQSFKGDCLVLSGTYSAHSGAVNWKELRMLDSGKYSWASGSTLKGKVTIGSGIDNPSTFAYFFANGYSTPELKAEFIGNADSVFRLARTTKGPPKKQSPDSYFKITGDWSKFLGTAVIATNTAVAFQSNVTAGNKIVGGKIVVERGGYWYGLLTFGFPSAAYTTVGSLELQDGSHYWAKIDDEGRASLVVVEDELVLSETEMGFYDTWTDESKLKSILPQYEIASEVKIPLFKLNSAAAGKAPDLTKVKLPDYPAEQKLGEVLPESKALVCIDNGDNTKTIYAKYWQELDWTMNTANAQSYASSAFNPANASYWKDGVCPAANDTGTAYIPSAMTWQGANASASFIYPNVKFIIGGNQYFYCSYVNTSNLIVNGGSAIFVHKGPGSKRIGGRLTVLLGNKQVTFYNYLGCTLYLDAELYGNGKLHLQPDSNANPKSFYYLNGDNGNFHGRMTVSHSFNHVTHGVFPNPAKSWFTTVYLRNGNSLGGTYHNSGDAWSAVTLGSYTKLKIPDDVDSVTLDEPTRGIFVTKQCVQIEPVAGQTLVVKSPVTYGGRLLKLGEGCLALGGEARFIDGNMATAPQDGTNIVEVAAGTLKVLTTNAVDGVQMEFSGTGSLAIDANNATGGFAEFGFVNTRWNLPFVTAGGGVPVKIEGVPEGGTSSVAICTVTAEAAENLTFKVANVPHCFKTVTRRENNDGTVTFIASFKPTSLRIHIR